MNKKVSRNDPCPCGSGEKYKKCCEKQALSQKQKKFSGLKGHSAKVIQGISMAGIASKVFKVLSDTAPSSVGESKLASLRQNNEELAQVEAKRGYSSLEELIGIDKNISNGSDTARE